MERGGDEITEHDEITRKYSNTPFHFVASVVVTYMKWGIIPIYFKRVFLYIR